VKFTLPGGSVRIGVSSVDGEFALVIADTGIGVDEAAVPHLCDPFYQANASMSRAHGGTGLGLAICSKLLKMHGASLNIASRRGHGTTVSAIFPQQRVVRRLDARRALT
jgi:two-component system phosphate regulon sensor histidine kinase PhoR